MKVTHEGKPKLLVGPLSFGISSGGWQKLGQSSSPSRSDDINPHLCRMVQARLAFPIHNVRISLSKVSSTAGAMTNPKETVVNGSEPFQAH